MKGNVRCAAFSLALGLLLALVVGATPALALSPWWQLTSASRPGNLPAQAGVAGEIAVTAENLGDVVLDTEGASGEVVLVDTLPAGLEATGIAGSAPAVEHQVNAASQLACSLSGLYCSFQ